ncbi:MAG: Hsp20/alpha crystallin family protein [Moorellales bacterium]
MYVSAFNPQAMAMAGGQIATALNPVLSWTAQPLTAGSWAAPAGMISPAYAGMSYMLPVSSAWAPAVSAGGAFGLPAGQAITYSFVPAMGTGIASPVLSGGFRFLHTGGGMVEPRVDISETNSDIVVTAELPNINPNDLNLTVTDDSLSISCTAFAGGIPTSVHRTIALPTSVKAEQVTANYSNGILECRLPKSDLAARRRIRVNPMG